MSDAQQTTVYKCPKCNGNFTLPLFSGTRPAICPMCRHEFQVRGTAATPPAPQAEAAINVRERKGRSGVGIQKEGFLTRMEAGKSEGWSIVMATFIGTPSAFGVGICWVLAVASKWDDYLVYLAMTATGAAIVVSMFAYCIGYIADRLTDIEALLANRK